MDNAADAPADQGSDPSSARRGHELRSEQQIVDTHEPAVAQLILAVRRSLTVTLGQKGCYIKLAHNKLGAIARSDRRPGDAQKLSKRYAYQMSSRTKTGPDWEMLEDVAAVCSPADRQAALEEFAALYALASRRPAPIGTASSLGNAIGHHPDLEAELRALRQENLELVRLLRAAGGEVAEALNGQVTAAQERATIAAEHIDVKTRLLMANLSIDGLKKEMAELTGTIDTLRSQREHERWNLLENRQERRELNERTARLIAFVAGLGNHHDLREALAFLPPSARLDVAFADSAPPERLALAGYLWTLAGLTQISIADLATKTDQHEDEIVALLSAATLPSYAVVLRVGEVLGCVGDYLLPLFRAAETPATSPASAVPRGPAWLPWATPARALDSAMQRTPGWAYENTSELPLVRAVGTTPPQPSIPSFDERRRRRPYADVDDTEPWVPSYPTPNRQRVEPTLLIFEAVRASVAVNDPEDDDQAPWRVFPHDDRMEEPASAPEPVVEGRRRNWFRRR
ncbi:MAG: hypothetical protein ABW156_08350 [Jiangellaceae bacterium]